jgi:hypothetical protein
MRKIVKILIISFIVIAGSFATIFGIFVIFNKPSARFGYGLVYDESIKKIVLFGGAYQYDSSYTYYDDTWVYDSNTNLWNELFPLNKPSARAGHSMVYDSVNQKIILFGGVDLGDNWLNETWIYDSRTNSWTQVFPQNSPPNRGSTSVYYDRQAQKVILFGGYGDTGGNLDDTWSYDYTTNNWTNLNPINKPTGRYGARMVYDPINQRGIMFGGRIITIMDDTWVYYLANNSWTELTMITKPSNRYWEAMAYDESAQKVILYGGRNSGAIGEALADTWMFDPSNDLWIEVFPSSHPSSRFDISLVYDQETQKAILFGGFRFPDNCFDDTWGYDYRTNSWSLLKGTNSN